MEEAQISAIVEAVVARNLGFSRAEILALVRDVSKGSVETPYRPEVSTQITESLESASAGGGGGGGGQEDKSQYPYYPESFRCVQDPITKEFSIKNPIVCTPSGQITATGADNLETGSYYCMVYRENGALKAEITDEPDTDEKTVIILVPIVDITETAIIQKHIGTIVVTESTNTRAAWAFDFSSDPPWRNTYIQAGWNIIEVTEGTDATSDGSYYVDVDISQSNVRARLVQGATPQSTDDHIYFTIGTISNKKQVSGIYSMPMIFMYR